MASGRRLRIKRSSERSANSRSGITPTATKTPEPPSDSGRYTGPTRSCWASLSPRSSPRVMVEKSHATCATAEGESCLCGARPWVARTFGAQSVWVKAGFGRTIARDRRTSGIRRSTVGAPIAVANGRLGDARPSRHASQIVRRNGSGGHPTNRLSASLRDTCDAALSVPVMSRIANAQPARSRSNSGSGLGRSKSGVRPGSKSVRSFYSRAQRTTAKRTVAGVGPRAVDAPQKRGPCAGLHSSASWWSPAA